jgi:DNA-binding LacI/PurR family transcriptional regulator
MAAYTSKDVARVAGVSQSTVSYVLTGNRPISEQTRRRVLDAIEQLTYQPNAGAGGRGRPRRPIVV